MGALLATLFVGLSVASADSQPGEPVNPPFNYMGLYIASYATADIDALVVRPPADAVQLNGTYSDADGNFTVPEEDGLQSPAFTFDTGYFPIEGQIGMTGDGSGHLDQVSGEMTLDLDLSLTLRVDEAAAASAASGVDFGTGEFACELSPIQVSLATDGGWPHPGRPFADPVGLTDGALAGYWQGIPPVTATIGSQAACDQLVSYIQPIAGLWLANSTSPLDEMPAATDNPFCDESGAASCCPVYAYPECMLKSWPGGPHPDDSEDEYDNRSGAGAGRLEINLKPRRVGVKPGRKKFLVLMVRNTGTTDLSTTVKMRSGNRRVRLRKSVFVSVPGRVTLMRTVAVKAGKRARGKVRITARIPGGSATSVLKVKRPAKRR